MKFKGRISKVIDSVVLVDILTNYHLLSSLKDSVDYDITIEEHKSTRSIEQNKLFWKNCQLIARELTEDLTKTYCDILERADIKSDFVVIASQDMENALKKSFRGSMFIKPVEVNNKTGYLYKVYIGSSKFNTKEMTDLIEITLDIMEELGI